MTTNYCPSCGEQQRSNSKFCSECGTDLADLDPTDRGHKSMADAGPAVETRRESDRMYRATVGLIVGWVAFLVLAVAIGSEALVPLAGLCLVGAIAAMYLDLRSLDDRLWQTRPIVWAIAAVLMFIAVAPLYVYKRRQIS